MYSELTNWLLVGGYVSPKINASLLTSNGVTHVVNASDNPLPQIIAGQFNSLEMLYANFNGASSDDSYWQILFRFVRRALRDAPSRLYVHVEHSRVQESPAAVYGVLRMLGYSALESRYKLDALHPIIAWSTATILRVDQEFNRWVKAHNFHQKLSPKVHVPLTALAQREESVPLHDLFEGDEEWI